MTINTFFDFYYFLGSILNYDLFIAVIGALSGSYIFLLIAFKPKIRICKKIAYYGIINDKPCYVFKIVNKSLFSAFDVTIELDRIEKHETHGGTNVEKKRVDIRGNRQSSIPRYRPDWWWRSSNAEYAMLFQTYENLDLMLDNDQNRLRIQVTSRHGLTGLSDVRKREYALKESIIEGKYTYGRSIKIIPSRR